MQTYWNIVDPTLRSLGMSSIGVQTIDIIFTAADAFVIFCIFGTLVSGAIIMANQTGGV